MNSPLQSAANFSPRLDSIRPESISYFKAVCNPTSSAKRLGIYQPKITYTQRHIGGYRMTYELAIELSLPKLIFGNNFDELVDSQFADVVNKLQETLRGMNIWLFTHQIEEAEVRAIDYSKNIVFTDYTSCSSILKYIAQVDISRRYDVQKTNFRNGGHIYHVHLNSMDIAFYDKLSDLRQAKTSEKRAYEDDNYIQLNLLDSLENIKPLAILRYELRLNNKLMIRKRLEEVELATDLVFKELFNQALAQKILIHNWKSFFNQIPLISLDSNEPDKIFANILKIEHVKPQQALAQLGYLLLREDNSSRYVRKLMEDRFGKHIWARMKKLTRDPPQTQYKALLAINNALQTFEPTKIVDIDI